MQHILKSYLLLPQYVNEKKEKLQEKFRMHKILYAGTGIFISKTPNIA